MLPFLFVLHGWPQAQRDLPSKQVKEKCSTFPASTTGTMSGLIPGKTNSHADGTHWPHCATDQTHVCIQCAALCLQDCAVRWNASKELEMEATEQNSNRTMRFDSLILLRKEVIKFRSAKCTSKAICATAYPTHEADAAARIQYRLGTEIYVRASF